VEAFKKARPEIWEFANKPVEVIRRPASPKRSRDLEDGEEENPRKLRRTRSSGRNKPKDQVVMDSAEDDDDYVPGKKSLLCLESQLTCAQKTGLCNAPFVRSLSKRTK